MTSPDRSWFARAAPVVGVELLNKLVVVERDGVICSGRIVETEAYMPDDPASHTFRGPTPRNQVMFGPAGHLYVYVSYGIHRCANVVTGPEDSGQAVLIRAVEPVDGIDLMRSRRNRPDRELTNGPGKLCEALGITAADDGSDLFGGWVAIVDDGVAEPSNPRTGPRVGITKAVDTPWRFRLPSD